MTVLSFCAILWVIYAWLPPAIHERCRLGLADSGLTSALYLQVGSAVGVLVGGVLGDWISSGRKTGHFDVVLIGMLCSTPFALALFATYSLVLLKMAAFNFGLCAGFFVANVFSSLYDVVESYHFSFATDVLNITEYDWWTCARTAILLAGAFKDSIGITHLMF